MIMYAAKLNVRWMIVVSFLLALILTFLRLPGWVEWFYPQWLVLVVLYWTLVTSKWVNIGIAWACGLFLDVLYNVPMGENALALVLVTYFLMKISTKLMLLDYWKETVVIFVLMVCSQLLPFLMQVWIDSPCSFWPILSKAFASASVWLIVMLLLDRKGKLYFENHH